MSKLFKYKISTAHEHHVRASGFDPHNPDRRHPVKPHEITQLVQTQSRQPDPRAQALINSRGKAGRALVRGLGIGLFGLAAMRSEKAFAFDESHILNKEGFPGFSMASFQWPDFHGPLWIVGLLGVICLISLLSLITQLVIAARLKPRTKLMPNLEPTNKQLPDFDEVSTELIISKDKQDQEPETKFKWTISGATRTGLKRSENQDAFAVFQNEEVSSGFVICDGAGGHEGGREASHEAVEHILEYIDPEKGNTLAIDRFARLQEAVDHARSMVEKKHINGLTTAIIGVVEGEWLYYSTLGDGALAVIWPDGMVSHHLTEHHVFDGPSNIITAYIGDDCDTPPRMGSVRLEPGCMIVAMSDGASDIFAYDDFAGNRENYGKAFLADKTNLPDDILKQIEAARDPVTNAYLHHDNMTLVMALLEQEEG